ncbi:sulfur carrier protein ThiS [Alteromonas sp. KUL49]|uniref:sulfur carrier protein ThiS n=1 Tax=Alteromonas sp. KUL49 TaxID=2480798 RepID=UPI00102EDFE6|nr:sulfur carrier protein ThiS [Alteromonas sp. KUL49]TAP40652.1 sulfur carrier protein ThiS [Alteromonas sp. KUL49]GEA10814.1 thiamine biosynthesis protein ThiS [Alteromonas sp. KUL49]
MATVTVNNEKRTIAVSTLLELLEVLDYGEAVVATAVNGNFVPQTMRVETLISDGDNVEILAPMQGG